MFLCLSLESCDKERDFYYFTVKTIQTPRRVAHKSRDGIGCKEAVHPHSRERALESHFA
jgi:hypothetical protein